MEVFYNLIGKDNVSAAVKTAGDAFDELKGRWQQVIGALGVSVSFGALVNMVKQSVEAADALGDLAEASGVSVEWLSSLKLAAELSGTSADGLAKATQKLQVQMVDAAKGGGEAAARFAALGINVTDAAGKLRPAEEVFMDLAEVFPNIESGAERTELAIRLFGKAGADMVPLLMQGRDGLVEMQRVSERLGLTISTETQQAAGRLADSWQTLGNLSKGFANELMRALAPALEGITRIIYNWRIEGEKSTLVVDALSAAFKGLVTAGAIVFGVFDALGKTIGGVFAGLVLALQGNFKGAWNALKESAGDVGKSVSDTAGFIEGLWKDQLPKLASASTAAKAPISTLGKSMADAGKEAADFAKETGTLITQVAAFLEKQALMIDGGRELTEGQREMLKIGTYLRDNIKNLSAAEAEYWAEQIRRIDANETTLRLAKDLKKAEEDYERALGKSVDQINNGSKSLSDKNEKLRDEIEKIGLSQTEHEELTKRRRADQLAALDQLLALKTLAGEGYDREYAALTRRRDELAENIRLEGSLADKSRAQAAMQAWADTFRDLGQSLSDWIMSGGKNAADYLRNLFKQLVLAPTVRMIASGLVGGLGSLFGLPGAAEAATGSGANGSPIASALMSMFGSTSFGAGLSGSIAGFTAGGSFSLLGGLANMGSSVASLLSGGSFMGALGASLPVLLPLLALAAIFSRRRSSPARQTFGIADAMGNAGPNFWASEVKNPTGDSYFDIVRSLSGSVRDTAGFLGGRINPNLLFGLYSSESPDGKGAQSVGRVFDWTTGRQLLNIDENGANDTLQQRLSDYVPRMLLAGLQGSDLPARFAEFFAKFNPATATIDEIKGALERANLSRSVDLLLSPLFRLGNASVEALASVADLSGGIENLARNAQGFVSNYYSEGEQQGMMAAQVIAQLNALGIDPASLTDASAYRRMVEALGADLNTGNNAERFAGLLSMQGTLAELFRVLADPRNADGSGKFRTLADLAALAPDGALAAMLANTSETSPAVAAQDKTTSAVQGLGQVWTDGIDQLRGDLSDLAARFERAVGAITTTVEVRVTKTDDTNVAVLPA